MPEIVNGSAISGVFLMRKILTATLAAGAMAAGVAQAATTITAQFQVSATVSSLCTVTAGPVAFTAYTPGGGNKVASGAIAVKCTNGTPFTVALDKGTTTGGTIAQRLMVGALPANTLQYNLFTTNTYGTIFGDGTTGVTMPGTGVGLSTAVIVTVYGQLLDNAANQLAVPGNYTDTITASVTY
jgi:spore coat protein U-like protein